MSNVVTFYSKKPQAVSVNGEIIANEVIEAAAAQFLDAREPRKAAARTIAVRTLLRQRAQVLRIEAADEESAIEQLLTREVPPTTVSDDAIPFRAAAGCGPCGAIGRRPPALAGRTISASRR